MVSLYFKEVELFLYIDLYLDICGHIIKKKYEKLKHVIKSNMSLFVWNNLWE